MGHPYRYLYFSAAEAAEGYTPGQTILKYDLATGKQQCWSAAPDGFTGEPIFVPRPGSTTEDEGWLLTLIYDASEHCSQLAILDAQNLACGPIARLRLKYHIPHGIHGTFTSEYFGPNSG